MYCTMLRYDALYRTVPTTVHICSVELETLRLVGVDSAKKALHLASMRDKIYNYLIS